MRIWHWVIVAFLLLKLSANAQLSSYSTTSASAVPASAPSTPSTTLDQVVDRALEREHALMEMLKTRTPIIETYLQNLKFDRQLGPAPVQDHYFLGRMDLGESLDRRDYLSRDASFESHLLGGFTRLFKFQYKPMGFSWMIYADRDNFNRKTYDFKYVHREFLGTVRCIVFDVSAKKGTGDGRFRGRIWVEDQDYNIVRLNGFYEPRPRNAYFFHLDSWRLNLIPGYWVPAYIYSEEGDFSPDSKDYIPKDKMTFKAQTRLWGYDLQKGAPDGEFTQVLVDSTVKDESAAAQDASPLEAQWQWQQQAGDNVIERLQNAGLLAPEGEVDKVLETVVNNLLTTNNIELPGPVRTRVMLTLPLETFSAGNTIVVSRGLVDVLPDEASLAMVLSRELAHIILGHNLGSKYAFHDRMLFSDESTYQNLGFRHLPEEETAADKKALELLKNSPYAPKLNTPGLFLRELAARGPALSALLTPHLGTGFTNHKGAVDRMMVLMNSAPALDPDKLDQIAALPLGGRVKLNAWDDHAELIKTTPVAITSARGKMPLEVSPFFPRLTRYGAVVNPTATANAPTESSGESKSDGSQLRVDTSRN
ncbi:MAG TPA: M48 family metalloprotease [Terriglobales bacterium]|nr:M48 family metalloprotease [Terriglobales bacterium]